MEPIPLRMRERIVALYEQNKRTEEIAELMGTCRSRTRRIRQYLRERGTLEGDTFAPSTNHLLGLGKVNNGWR